MVVMVSKRPDSKIGTKGATRPDSKIRTKGANFPIQNRDEGSKKKIFFFFSQSVDRKCQSDHSAESLTGLSKRPS